MKNKKEIETMIKETAYELRKERAKYKDIYIPIDLTMQKVKYLNGMLEALKWVLEK